MVKEDAITGIHAIGFSVVNGNPVGVELGHGIRRTWVEGRGFLLGDFLNEPVELRGRGLVEASLLLKAENADGFEDTQSAECIGVGSVFGFFKADLDVALSGQVVDFVRLGLLNDAD